MLIAGLLLVVRLAFVQVLDGSRYAAYAQSEVEQSVVLPASRGPIYDRTGGLLTISVPRADVIADDFLIHSPDSVAAQLAPILKTSRTALVTALSQSNGYVVLARQVAPTTETAVENANINGISFVSDSLRQSPAGSLFEPLLGGVNGAGEGDASLEYQLNSTLAGRSGSEVVAQAPGGVDLPSPARQVVAPKQGSGVVLTIDEPLQLEVTKDVTAQMIATHADSGVAEVMDVRSGAVLAMVDLVKGPHGKIAPAASNLLLTSVYQPGSVMKLATVSYSLQDHLISACTPFTVPYQIGVGGYTFQDADVHPTQVMAAKDILAQSSNVGTIEIAHLLGMQRLGQAIHSLGFGQPSGLNWPGESEGIVSDSSQWVGSSQASVPIGTGIAVTPQQVLDAYNAVANGGVLVPPHIVGSTVQANGTEHLLKAAAGHRVLQASTVTALVPMLEGVVDENGTAYAAHVPGYTVAGKTGTAQVPDSSGLGYVTGDWNASFVGFVPAQAPELSGIVVLNHPTPIYGGTVSAPVFAQIMQYALHRFNITPPSTPAVPIVCSGPAKSR